MNFDWLWCKLGKHTMVDVEINEDKTTYFCRRCNKTIRVKGK